MRFKAKKADPILDGVATINRINDKTMSRYEIIVILPPTIEDPNPRQHFDYADTVWSAKRVARRLGQEARVKRPGATKEFVATINV